MNFFKSDLCLLCSNTITRTIGWTTLLLGLEKTLLCEKCQGQMQRIQGEICQICSRPLDKLDPQFRIGHHCLDCTNWEKSSRWKNVLEKNYSLYEYNDFMTEVIARFKYRGDYAIAKVFSASISEQIQKIEYDLLVPIPLSEERLYERGFNQAESLIIEAGFAPTNLLTRVHTEKQSKKTRNERIHLPQVFQIAQTSQPIRQKRILLIDDVYTTGSTLRHAAERLKQAGAKSIKSLTLARG